MFKNELMLVPKKSGCYKMINSSGIIIYIGKAKNLQNRLRSYFTGKVTGKTEIMVHEVSRFEYIVTSSEVEAFILELNLIKEYNPKYNILLKDDKSYPYIEITNEKYPRIIVRRELNIIKKSRRLYGPFPNVYAARRLVNSINRLYPLKKCDRMPKKVCLYYHINQCLGYCINKDAESKPYVDEISQILSGKTEILLNKMKEKLELFSSNMQYEDALSLKEEYDFLKNSFNNQKVEINDGITRDIFACYEKDGFISIEIFFLRNGKLVGNHSKIKPIISDLKNELEYYIASFYLKKNIVPREVIVPLIVDCEIISKVINSKVISVQRGIKKRLYDLCEKNAEVAYENNKQLIALNSDKNYKANNLLKNLLNMDKLSRIEVFDNSNLFGTFTVSGMVVFIDGEKAKNEYRKFKISTEVNDDVLCMKEVIYRRYYKLLLEKKELPELIIVDGGINQINAAKAVLNELKLSIRLCGIFKDDKHCAAYLIDGENNQVLNVDKSSELFLFLTRMSDEVHRYTIEYHKSLRSTAAIKSEIDNVPGIGVKRRKKLIKAFSSVKNLRQASVEEISKVIPKDVAIELVKYLRYNDKGEKS
ncbi:MAG: excinuclease ABC subunit UvrC [Bacilli bacterium]